jgi:tRNA1Val (adenine37-N6)-methyltransferase
LNYSDLSREEFFGGQLILYQPRRGYRFSIDAFLLAGFVRLKPGELALELGAGCGVISLWLARRVAAKILALEIQERLVSCLALNIRENALEDRVLGLRADLRRPPFKPEVFDVVFSNPPFHPLGRGRLAPTEEERLARHEILTTLEEVIVNARRLLRLRGRFSLIYSAQRLPELFVLLKREGLEPKRLRLVHSYPGDQGRLVLMEAIKGGGKELHILPPLFIYETRGGSYTAEVKQLFEAS